MLSKRAKFSSGSESRLLVCFAAERSCRFALVGCTVAPGFDFADFELATRSELIRAYPAHRKLIEELTRP